jgi:hypothetical protein
MKPTTAPTSTIMAGSRSLEAEDEGERFVHGA